MSMVVQGGIVEGKEGKNKNKKKKRRAVQGKYDMQIDKGSVDRFVCCRVRESKKRKEVGAEWNRSEASTVYKMWTSEQQ